MHELTCFHIFKDVILSYMQLMNRANLPSGLSIMTNVNDPCSIQVLIQVVDIL